MTETAPQTTPRPLARPEDLANNAELQACIKDISGEIILDEVSSALGAPRTGESKAPCRS